MGVLLQRYSLLVDMCARFGKGMRQCPRAVVKEDLYGALYDCSTDKVSNVQEARKRSLDVSNSATYRLQFQRTGEVGFYFCYLPADVDLLDQPPLAPESAQPDVGAGAKKRD